MTIEIEPVELDGKYFIDVTIDGHAMERRGPFPDADTAETIAERMRRVGRALMNGGGDHG